MNFTEEEINNIIGLTGNDGKQIDIFKLYGVLYIGNLENGTWDLTKTFVKFSNHRLSITIEDFEDCDTEECIKEKFGELLEEAISNQLI